MHRRFLTCVSLLLFAASLALDSRRAEADWPPDGVSLCTECSTGLTLVVPDGTGGALVVWADSWSGDYDVYAQHVTSSGEIAPGWPAATGRALPISAGPKPEFLNDIAPDGFGGLLVAWFDYRGYLEGTQSDIYAQRILADGTIAPGWAPGGMPVTRAPGDQQRPVVLADGEGGAFVSWDDAATDDIYLQRLAPDGTPAPGWPVGGVLVCSDPSGQGNPILAPDGGGGVLIAWGDLRDVQGSTYAQHVLSDGSIAPGWPANGLRIVLGRGGVELVSDQEGGGYLACNTISPFFDDDYYLQRFTGGGAIAPGWPEGGAPVCLAPNERAGLVMVGDGLGGALLAWSDFRDGAPDQIFASRFAADGTLRPGWPVDGLRLTSDIALNDAPDLAPDGMGGAFICWDKYTNELQHRVHLQHVTGTAEVAPGWPVGGRLVPTVGQARRPRITADGAGGAIVAWEHGDYTVRALRIPPDAPTPVQVSLVAVDSHSDHVRLEWLVARGSLRVTVERRLASGEWQVLAETVPDGTGAVVYEDRTVTPGARYGYRLGWSDGEAMAYGDEVVVEVPAPRFALDRIAPNPSRGDPMVSFSLASAGSATLELYDLHGRLVRARELGALEPRTHTVRLETGPSLPAGVYSIRLRQGVQTAIARLAIVR